MSFYEKFILPRFINLLCGNKEIRAERDKALVGVRGDVLEVGFGTGLNLPHYTSAIKKLVAVDPSAPSAKLARRRIEKAPFPVEFLALPGEEIAAPDSSFDSVVCTFSLCTIPDPIAALRHMLRVLKPDGRLFFLEHGRSNDPKVRRWQDRLNSFQNWMCGGCNTNRPIDRMITEAGFRVESLEQYYGKGAPKPLACLYRGTASRPS
jgi:ubiquinone/menaquinone biosynthesis C-methylase UbiE